MPDTEIVAEPDTYGVADAANPEPAREKVKRGMRFKDLPQNLQDRLSAIQETARKKRGPQKAPTKKQVTMRLPSDGLILPRAKGPGWQPRVDEILREYFVDRGLLPKFRKPGFTSQD